MSDLTRAEVVERLATVIRDQAYPEFRLAPPPEWATRAAEQIIDFHQPMLKAEVLRPYRSLIRRAARWLRYLDEPTLDDTEVWVIQATNVVGTDLLNPESEGQDRG